MHCPNSPGLSFASRDRRVVVLPVVPCTVPIPQVYRLRPETVESLYYMWYYTGDERFQRDGYEIWRAISKYTKTKYGYSAVAWQKPERVSKQPGHLLFKPKFENKQESYFPAETLKYFFLLFSKRTAFNLEDFVFNTEGHPFKRYKR